MRRRRKPQPLWTRRPDGLFDVRGRGRTAPIGPPGSPVRFQPGSPDPCSRRTESAATRTKHGHLPRDVSTALLQALLLYGPGSAAVPRHHGAGDGGAGTVGPVRDHPATRARTVGRGDGGAGTGDRPAGPRPRRLPGRLGPDRGLALDAHRAPSCRRRLPGAARTAPARRTPAPTVLVRSLPVVADTVPARSPRTGRSAAEARGHRRALSRHPPAGTDRAQATRTALAGVPRRTSGGSAQPEDDAVLPRPAAAVRAERRSHVRRPAP